MSMSSEGQLKLKQSLTKHEGYCVKPYVDTVDKITIGIGYNLTDRGMTHAWIDKQYQQDVDYLYQQLFTDFNWFSQLNEDRQIILIDMCFMGYKHFLEFKEMIRCLFLHDYESAAQDMLQSKWATQVGKRAIDLAEGMRTGVYNVT